MFGVEHIMLGFVIVLRIALDSDPQWVTIFFARQRFQREQKALSKLKAQKIGAGMLQSFIKKQTTLQSQDSLRS